MKICAGGVIGALYNQIQTVSSRNRKIDYPVAHSTCIEMDVFVILNGISEWIVFILFFAIYIFGKILL